ncbi:prepilin peptidase [Desulfotruncus arcticus]|uniref:prepilin peptidase n=1 Tax=Desulfotruncus arcticus TaxID=341036 RepID=UPI000B8216CE|nr:prepilin peptidase [Desulfotruncus arcticus]
MFLLYLFGAIGGGDVKLAAAVGALAGPWFTIGMLGLEHTFQFRCRHSIYDLQR